MSRLFVVATPMGNLKDVSFRCLRVLDEVELIAAEDTRTARVLLDRYGVKQRLMSYTEHNKRQRIPQLLQELSQHDVALVTDAGTPAISDPGVELVAAARGDGHEVVSVPGPSAVVAALSIAGLPATPFYFAGFLPRSRGQLRSFLQQAANRNETTVAFESPQRLRGTLEVLSELLPGRRIAVCRELTKLHEETFVGTAEEALEYFTQPRGEIVLLIQGSDAPAVGPDENALRAEVEQMKRQDLTRSQATALLTQRYSVGRRRIYELWLEDGGGST